jgi:hypothetical protein
MCELLCNLTRKFLTCTLSQTIMAKMCIARLCGGACLVVGFDQLGCGFADRTMCTRATTSLSEVLMVISKLAKPQHSCMSLTGHRLFKIIVPP